MNHPWVFRSGKVGAEKLSPSIAGWREIAICYEELEAVRQLLQFGDNLEVLSPPTARERVRELAADLAARHG